LLRLEQRLLDNGFKLELTEAALDKIAEAGFDPVFGARPLKRAIQQTIENPLAQTLLSGDFKSGSVFVVDCQQNEIVIKVQ
jgi:ATP-dependent Clp protease ATP-binding subunit ClpB